MSEASQQLLVAAALGDPAALDAALSAGAPPGGVDPALGLTPLMLAARGGHIGALQRLLDAGAQPDERGRGGVTALALAAMADQPAALAALLDAGAELEVPAASGAQPVHLAASTGALRALRVLEERGASLSAADARGLTVTDYATKRGHTASVASFLDAAGLRARYRALHRLLADPDLITRLVGPRPDPSALAAADADAPELVVLPPDTGPVAPPEVATMRAMTATLGPMSPEVFEATLLDHRDFLASGGDGAGRWHSFHDEGLVFALYDGPAAAAGRRADLHLRDLSLTDGGQAVLRGAHLVGIVAEGVNFSGADLSCACVTDAALSGAGFDDARLVRADLSRADLRGASLIGADLRHADLEGCDLRGADLRGARLAGVKLGGADLRGAIR